jgi:hypothetical protein
MRGHGFGLWYGRRQRLNPAPGKGAMSSDAAGDCLQLSPAENPLPHCVLQHRARERASGSRWTPRWREMDFELFGSWSRDRQTVTGEPVRQPEPVLTIGKRRFTVRRARLAPAMISTPGHRASRRRQRGALPAWSLFGSSLPMPGDAVSCKSSMYVTSRSLVTNYTLRSDTTIESAAHWRPRRFRIRSSRGGRPYRGGPRVRIHLPPALSPLRTRVSDLEPIPGNRVGSSLRKNDGLLRRGKARVTSKS